MGWHLGMGVRLEDTAKGVTRMKEVSSFRICLVPQVMGSESEERPQQGVYYMMTGRVWIWRRGKKREKWINVVRLTVYLTCSASIFPGNRPLVLETGIRGWVGGRKLGGKNWSDPLEVGPERKRRTIRLLITKLGIKLWGWT